MDISKLHQDFPMLQQQMQGQSLIYFDNSATTFKPKSVIEAITKYLTDYTANASRGDYDLSYRVDQEYEGAREKVRTFINAAKNEEIVFTYGTTDGLNIIAFGYALQHLKQGDEILISVEEHASNTLPWFEIVKETGAIIKYIPLDRNGRITLENVQKTISDKTKIISLAEISNVLGYQVPIKEITKLAHLYDIKVIVDGAQSVPHKKTDVIDSDVDFLVFSGHKMCGPTGVGVLYGKYHLLAETNPTRFGGGSNARYQQNGKVILKETPSKFEAGTMNIEGIIGLGAAIDYLSEIGMDTIYQHEVDLRSYCVKKMQELDNLTIYNADSEIGPISFNIKNVFSQDAASLFNSHGIAVRAGQHCAKILDNYLEVTTTIRASFYFYNTEAEIDKFIEVCKKGENFLDAFFG